MCACAVKRDRVGLWYEFEDLLKHGSAFYLKWRISLSSFELREQADRDWLWSKWLEFCMFRPEQV